MCGIASKEATQLIQRLKKIFNVKDNMMSHEDIHKMMIDNTRIRGSNLCILMLAIVIACVGLNTDSTAVIIGAMLISPLMSCIITMGYSIAAKELNLFGHALIRFGAQVAISLATSTLYFALSPLSAATSELLARTRPTIWDVIIAICGGLAGMIGCTRKERSNVIPGVAIATALMPPLCTAGYGIATLQASFFFGGFYLFFINTLFIAISSGLIAKALDMPIKHELPENQQKRLNRRIIVLAVVTIVPSLVSAGFTVYDSITEAHIAEFVEENIESDELMIVKQKNDLDTRTITLAVIGRHISDEEALRINSLLADYRLDGFTLRIIQNAAALPS